MHCWKNLIVPPVHPIAVGVKLTVRLTLCPAGKTSGRLKEDVVNSELPTVIPETGHTRPSIVRHGDKQGFGLTDNDSAKSKIRGMCTRVVS